MNIETMAHAEIEDRLMQMSKLSPSEDEYKAIADVTLKLIDRATKMEELNIQNKEYELKLMQMKEDQKDRKWDHVLRGVGIALPPTVAIVAAVVFSVIERTEIVASTPTKEFMKRALRLS